MLNTHAPLAYIAHKISCIKLPVTLICVLHRVELQTRELFGMRKPNSPPDTVFDSDQSTSQGAEALNSRRCVRFPPDGFTYCLTLFSKCFSSFPHGTCSLSVSCHYGRHRSMGLRGFPLGWLYARVYARLGYSVMWCAGNT